MVTAKGLLSVSMFIFMIVFESVALVRPRRGFRSSCEVLTALSVPKKTPAGSTVSISPGCVTCADVWMNLPAIALSITLTQQPCFTPQT